MSTREDPFASVAALPGVVDVVGAARDAVDRLTAHGVLRLRQADATAETALRGARASAALEGADVELDALRSGAAFDDPDAGPTARAAVRLSAELGLVASTWAKAPRQALARLHVVAAADAVADRDALGRPASAAAAARLDQLADLLIAPTAAPAVVVAALVHGEILAANAFGWGNGLVARAACRLVLIGRGVDPKAIASPDVGHVELGLTEYQVALAGYVGGTAEGVAGWVRHCARALLLGAREGTAVCSSLRGSG